MKHILLLILTLFFVQFASGQDYVTRKTAKEKAKKAYKAAYKYGMNRQNKEALKECNKAIRIESKFVDAYVLRADLHYENKDLDKAKADLETAIKLAPKYKTRVHYTLASIYYMQKDYEKARQYYTSFVESDTKLTKLKKKAESYIKNSHFIEHARENQVPFDYKKMSANINTSNDEYLPCFVADGNTMIYTVKERGQEDFYISTKKDGVWQKGKNMGRPLNTEKNEGAQTISADGQTIVFTMCNREGAYGSCDLYYSKKENGNWSRPKNIGAPINSAAWESQPSLGADGKTLYFVRKGTIGRVDIFVSYLKNNQWSKPENLGEPINTKGYEGSPFIHADGQTLYFMSDGHPGMGETDIFVSRKDENGKWSTPVNLGYPINTTRDEGSFVVSLDGETAYFASNRGNSKGDINLYYFELYESARPNPVTYVKAQVIDALTKKPLIATVETLDLLTNKNNTTAITNEKGEFLVCLPIGQDYALNVNKKGYLFHSEHFDLKEVKEAKDPYVLVIELQAIPPKVATSSNKPITSSNVPFEKSKPIVLNNIFFDFNKASLKPTSFPELNYLKQLLLDYPSMNIQINGHTDNKGSDAYNLTLSENRAKAVRDYLIQQGITSSRLSYKGYGETEPIDTNETEQGRKNNRRTEFIIR